jgi:hypothetical protein
VRCAAWPIAGEMIQMKGLCRSIVFRVAVVCIVTLYLIRLHVFNSQGTPPLSLFSFSQPRTPPCSARFRGPEQDLKCISIPSVCQQLFPHNKTWPTTGGGVVLQLPLPGGSRGKLTSALPSGCTSYAQWLSSWSPTPMAVARSAVPVYYINMRTSEKRNVHIHAQPVEPPL